MWAELSCPHHRISASKISYPAADATPASCFASNSRPLTSKFGPQSFCGQVLCRIWQLGVITNNDASLHRRLWAFCGSLKRFRVNMHTHILFIAQFCSGSCGYFSALPCLLFEARHEVGFAKIPEVEVRWCGQLCSAHRLPCLPFEARHEAGFCSAHSRNAPPKGQTLQELWEHGSLQHHWLSFCCFFFFTDCFWMSKEIPEWY